MFCEKCGKEMLDTAKFCPSCGASAEPELDNPAPEDTPVETEPIVSANLDEEPVIEPEPEKEEVPPVQPTYGVSKDLTKPLSTASYFGMFFLMALPVIKVLH
jgi:hypothetical protein